MSQVTDFTIPISPLTMSELKTVLEDCFAALGSINRGATAPSNPFEGMLWWDNAANPEILKRYTVTAGWVTILSINITTGAVSVNPTYIDDSSANAAAMQTTTDPYPGGAISLPTSSSGELQRIRYMIQQLSGMAQWYHDPVGTVWIPASAMLPYGASPATPYVLYVGASPYQGFDVYLFDGAVTEYVCMNVVMPDDWNLGTIKAKFYWTAAPYGCAATTGDNVEWRIYSSARGNDDLMEGTGSPVNISDALTANNGVDLQISPATAAITVSYTPAMGDLLQFIIARWTTGTDDMEEQAALIGVLIQYTKGSTAGAAW